ncbi:MAG: protein kinase [Acidobacteriota bacterium]
MQQPGTLIEGKYEILGKIREGGMGAIYKVRHRLLDEIRVVKVMRTQALADEELKQRFVEEAKTATRLKHPNICTIHDFALDADGTAYLVMEFIDGATVAELSRTPARPGIGTALEIAQQTLLALAYLHRRNVVHRDVAPDNIMVTHDEEGRPLVKLIDLGIAKALDKPGADMTSTGVFLGKLKYASPEQYGALPPGEKIDGRSDLYSLGVVLYELLTGARPFSGETPAELLRAHLFSPPLPFAESDPHNQVPEELRQAILKALEKKREERYGTAEDFHREILRIKSRMAASEAGGAEATVTMLSRARASRDDVGSPTTPSAQDRLDRQFIAAATPHPSNPPLRTVERRDETEASSPSGTNRITVPFPRRRRSGLGLLAAGLAVGALAAYFALRPPRDAAAIPPGDRDASSGRSGGPAAPAPAAPPAPRAAALEPTEAPSPAPTEIPEAEPTAQAPAVRATRPPTPQATPRRPATPPPRRTEPPRIAAVLPPPVPSPAVSAPFVSESPRRADPTPRPAPPPLPPAAPSAAPEPKSVSSESDRIRDAIRRYERAQNTLDTDLYARVFPGADRARVQAAFDNFRSQTVTFENIRVDVVPGATRATARLHERRVAVPRVGSEQRLEGDRTIQLQKQGDGWIITGLR